MMFRPDFLKTLSSLGLGEYYESQRVIFSSVSDLMVHTDELNKKDTIVFFVSYRK